MLEDAQVLGDGGAGDLELRGDLAGGQLAVADELQDAAAARLGDGLQDGVHGRSLVAPYESVN